MRKAGVDERGNVTLTPVGVVRNQVKELKWEGWETVVSRIELRDDLVEAAEGLEEFSHIIVLYFMHQALAEAPVTKVHPRRRQDLPLVGVFATRSPRRPNPLGLSVVRLLGRRGGMLEVVGLDAIDGTPVLDIKPYLPGGDSVPEARTAPWLQRL